MKTTKRKIYGIVRQKKRLADQEKVHKIALVLKDKIESLEGKGQIVTKSVTKLRTNYNR